MESVWRRTPSHPDEISPTSAYSLLDDDTGMIIQSLQNAGEALVIAGGFISFTLGLTTSYGDIDLFVHPLSFNQLVKKLTDIGLTLRFQQVSSHSYPGRELEVWNVYNQDGSRQNSLQVIVLYKQWVYDMLTHRIGSSAVLPVPDGLLFARCVLRDFDLAICRCGLYQSSYIQR